jgi:transposase/Pyruvate/2-oxoacid:ferredoxin oxidoreductase delta subunit
MALRKFDRSRQNFELINPAERIPEDHICFLVKDIVESNDFSKLNEKFLHTPGEPAYDREQLAMLVLMGAVDGVFSGRDIEEQARFNFAYIYLSGNATPSYKTINRFKKESKEFMKQVFVRTREMGRELGIVKLENLAIDGTTVKANASKNSRYDIIDLLIAKELVDKGIAVDEEEDILYDKKSGYTFTPEQFEQLKKELKKKHKINDNKAKKNKKTSKKNKKDKSTEKDTNDEVNNMGIKKKVLKIVKQGEKNKPQTLKKIDEALKKAEERNMDKISLTDPDAHWGPNKQHYYQLFHNLQIIGDTDSRFIIDNRVVDAATDMNQVIPLMTNLQSKIGDLDENTLLNLDNGYYSGENLKYLEEQGFDALIPNKNQASQAKGKTIGKFHKHNFIYDPVNDAYICPNEKILHHQSTSKKKVKLYYCNDCHLCSDKNKCCKTNVRVISAYQNEQYMQRMKIKFEDENNKTKYNQRGIIEGNFGHIFNNLRFISFLTRGNENVQTEADILSFANNTRRIHTEITKIKQKNKKLQQNNT